MSKDDEFELFSLAVRGQVAMAFQSAGLTPNEHQWEMLRGDADISIRDLSDISVLTKTDLTVMFVHPPIENEKG